jgi:hypothetical protein
MSAFYFCSEHFEMHSIRIIWDSCTSIVTKVVLSEDTTDLVALCYTASHGNAIQPFYPLFFRARNNELYALRFQRR